MECKQYISVMVGASSTGNLNFQFQTLNLLSNITLTLAVSGVTGTESTIQLAQKINTQVNTYLTQLGMVFKNTPPNLPTVSYPPYLYFTDQPAVAIWSVTNTDHVTCISGQTVFNLTLLNNDIGAKFVIDEYPVLMDLVEGKNLARTWGAVWEDYYGNDLSDDDIIEHLSTASARMTAHLQNNIVASTYIHYTTGTGARSIRLNKYPIIDFYPPTIRRPIIGQSVWQQTSSNSTVKQNYMPDRETGWLEYRYSQDFVDNIEPFDRGNEVICAYIGGYYKIPKVIKHYTVRLAQLIRNDEFKEIKGEGTEGKYQTTKEVLESWANFLYQYFRS